jgi:hypothetical protein
MAALSWFPSCVNHADAMAAMAMRNLIFTMAGLDPATQSPRVCAVNN